MMGEPDILRVLSMEEDVCHAVMSSLDVDSLLNFELTSREARELLVRMQTWRRLSDTTVKKWSNTHNWGHLQKKIEADDSKINSFKKMVVRLNKLEKRWKSDDGRVNTIQPEGEILLICCDYKSILLVLASGELQLYDRQTREKQLMIKTDQPVIQSVEMSQSFIFTGDLRKDRYLHPLSPTVNIYCRKTGLLVNAVTANESLSVSSLSLGCQSLVVSQSLMKGGSQVEVYSVSQKGHIKSRFFIKGVQSYKKAICDTKKLFVAKESDKNNIDVTVVKIFSLESGDLITKIGLAHQDIHSLMFVTSNLMVVNSEQHTYLLNWADNNLQRLDFKVQELDTDQSHLILQTTNGELLNMAVNKTKMQVEKLAVRLSSLCDDFQLTRNTQIKVDPIGVVLLVPESNQVVDLSYWF